MAAYNFKARFVPLIESGVKRSTIRACRLDGRVPKIGETLYLYTGMRTKSCRLIRERPCQGVHTVDMAGTSLAACDLVVDARMLPAHERDWIAQRDGFKDWEEMRHWFAKTHDMPFFGNLIEW